MAFVALAVVAGGVLLGKRYVASSQPKIQYDTTPVAKGHVIAKVTATGTLSAHVTVLVGSQVSGRVAELFADWNSTVKKGQLLATIDPQLFQAAVASSSANRLAAAGALAKAKAQAINAELQYNREKELVAKNLVAQADLDTAKAAFESAKADVQANQGQVAQADAQLHQAQLNLGYTKIASPVDGVVISRSVDIGQTVAAALQAPTLFTIAQDLHQMQVDTNVAESDVGKLTPGMAATFTVDAFPNDRFKGKVREVRNAPQTLQSVVTYDAVIDVENPELKLRPGMTANCTFVYADRDNVIALPNAALRFKPAPDILASVAPSPSGSSAARGQHQHADGGGGRDKDREGPPPDRKMVWILRDGVLTRAKVHTGISDGTVTEVLDGDVAEGDALVLDMSTGGAPKPAPANTGRTPGMGRMF